MAKATVPATATAARDAVRTVAPQLIDYTESVLYGDLWERPDLTARDRSLATVAALIALGRTEQLPTHLTRALANGLTWEEIGELITHLAFYAGWPAAMSAGRVAAGVRAEQTPVKVGFIGLGTMGQHMAANLQAAGYDLVVHDVRPAAAESHLAAGAVWAQTPAEVMAAADVVFTSLPTPAVVEDVALGESGLLQSAGPGKVLFDLSTNSPTTVRQLEQAFRAKDCAVCDAPVSGGPAGARSKKLAVYIGGDRAVFDKHRDLLGAFSDEQLYVGAIGAGTVAKLAHNLAGYMINTALAEVFTMGVRGGVDPLDLWRALRMGSVGRRRTFDSLANQFLPRAFDPASFSLKLAHKDVGLANEFARELGIPMRIGALTFAEMTEAMARGWGDRDSRIAMLLQEERAGLEIEIPREDLRTELDR